MLHLRGLSDNGMQRTALLPPLMPGVVHGRRRATNAEVVSAPARTRGASGGCGRLDWGGSLAARDCRPRPGPIVLAVEPARAPPVAHRASRPVVRDLPSLGLVPALPGRCPHGVRQLALDAGVVVVH